MDEGYFCVQITACDADWNEVWAIAYHVKRAEDAVRDGTRMFKAVMLGKELDDCPPLVKQAIRNVSLTIAHKETAKNG